MRKRSSMHSHRSKEAPELDITAFLNLMVVLIPFLLITAVFSRITILELNLPASSGADAADDKKLTVEIIVRHDNLEIGDGSQIVTRIPNTEEGAYDIATLSKVLVEIKRNFPDKLDATVLMESDIEYDVLIIIMDAVGSAELANEGGLADKVELFPQISIGDAPGQVAATNKKTSG